MNDVGPLLMNAYIRGAEFARTPAGHDDPAAWARSLTGYAARYAESVVTDYARTLAQNKET